MEPTNSVEIDQIEGLVDQDFENLLRAALGASGLLTEQPIDEMAAA
jgi:hypothetical protein